MQCPVCHKQKLVTRRVGIPFLLCQSCQESWRPTASRTPSAHELDELVRISRELVGRARDSWQTLREYSLEPPSRLPLMPIPLRRQPDRIA